MSQRLRVNIDTAAITRNTAITRSIAGANCGVMAVVKADGYGHGIVESARAAARGGAAAFAVATVEEGIALRGSADYIGVPRDALILVLGAVFKGSAASGADMGLTQTVYSLDSAKLVADSAAEKPADVHIKIDTGMSRLGLPADEGGLRDAVSICRVKRLNVTGIFSHFADGDNADQSFANAQIERFRRFVDALEGEGIHIPAKHMANSAAALTLPRSRMDYIRPGVILYGLSPSSPAIDAAAFGFTPAMTVTSEIVSLRKLNKGESVGYGRTFVTSRPTLIATIPVGYADGYPRSASNAGFVAVNGRRAAIAGAVCMDQLMVDVTDIEGVSVGSTATLIGEGVSADEAARAAGTIGYELVCSLGAVRRGERGYSSEPN